MKQAQNARKGRTRSNAQKRSRGSDGNRADFKLKGNPKQLLDKYKNQAREAMQAGDRVQAENFHQFADHYQRVINEMRGLTRGLFHGEYEPVPGAVGSDGSSEERAQEPEATPSGKSENTGQRRHRRGRDNGDRPREQEAAPVPSQPRDETSIAGLPGPISLDEPQGDQPPEVHPELDLVSGETRPKRGRRPRREKQEDVGSDSKDGEGEAA